MLYLDFVYLSFMFYWLFIFDFAIRSMYTLPVQLKFYSDQP
jgi:hypothetical protein